MGVILAGVLPAPLASIWWSLLYLFLTICDSVEPAYRSFQREYQSCIIISPFRYTIRAPYNLAMTVIKRMGFFFPSSSIHKIYSFLLFCRYIIGNSSFLVVTLSDL